MPFLFRRGARRGVLVTFLAAALCAHGAAALAQATAILSGVVTSNGAPLAGADVTATGGNVTQHATTATNGAFRFVALPVGTYRIAVTSAAGTAALSAELTGSGASVTIDVAPLKQIGSSAVTARPPARGSGTDLSLNERFLSRSAASGSLPNLLLQLPGAARGANGVVHVNGDHGDLNYIVDGVPIPQTLNRTIGTEFDAGSIAFVEALQGAYPAQYGERFASVLNINSRNGSGRRGLTGEVSGGSYAAVDASLAYQTTLGHGSLVLATRNARTDRGLDPPNFDSPHDRASNANQFLRYTLPSGRDFVNLTLSHAYQTYQIPADVAGGEPARTDDVDTQDDLFAALQFRHPIGDRGSLSFGPFLKRSRIRDLPDEPNDIAFGIASSAAAAPTDCAGALASAGPVVGGIVTNPVANPRVAYGNGTCAYALFGDRTAVDAGGNLDYVNQTAHHAVAFGGYADATHVRKTYAVTLQPGNFLAPIFTPATPGAAYTVVDSAPNVGRLLAFYVQDGWRMGRSWQLDYGVRTDAFTVSSTEFAAGFGQFSPRVKLTRFFGPRDSAYAYYGRFFTPFSLENVSPVAAYTLNLPLQSRVAAFDLRPQRDSVYEIGGHVGLGRGDLGVRFMQKNATDLIDDAQVGVTNLHQDINFAQGRIASQTAYYQVALANAGRFYASLTHTFAVNRGCETQLLAPCFGASGDWTPADHDQRVDATAGMLRNDRRGGWFAIDAEYGSGLTSAVCEGCKRTPHLTFDLERGVGLGNGTALTLRVRNLLNDRYLVTYRNAQGNHEAPPRTIEVGLRFGDRGGR